MKNHRDTIELHSEHKEQIINITSELQGCLERPEITEGMMLVFPLHTSCAVYLSDSDDNLTRDTQETLRSLIPSAPPGKKSVYHHNKRDPKQNAPAHLKAVLLGHHVTLPITEGEFDLAPITPFIMPSLTASAQKKYWLKPSVHNVFLPNLPWLTLPRLNGLILTGKNVKMIFCPVI